MTPWQVLQWSPAEFAVNEDAYEVLMDIARESPPGQVSIDPTIIQVRG